MPFLSGINDQRSMTMLTAQKSFPAQIPPAVVVSRCETFDESSVIRTWMDVGHHLPRAPQSVHPPSHSLQSFKSSLQYVKED